MVRKMKAWMLLSTDRHRPNLLQMTRARESDMAYKAKTIGHQVSEAPADGVSGKSFDSSEEGAYWLQNYNAAPYVSKGEEYGIYEPAYRYGWESYEKNRGRKFEDIESELSRDWEKNRGTSSLPWDKAKPAAQDAWSRVHLFLTGDADREFRQILGAAHLPPGGNPTLYDGKPGSQHKG